MSTYTISDISEIVQWYVRENGRLKGPWPYNQCTLYIDNRKPGVELVRHRVLKEVLKPVRNN